MRTVKITRMEDAQVGDLVTLEDRRDPSDDGTFEPDPEWRLTGHVRAIDVTRTTRDGEPYGWSVWIGHTPYTVGYLSPGGVMWAYSLVSATREVPEWEPATGGTATVGGDDGDVKLRGMWAQRGQAPAVFIDLEGDVWGADLVRSFVPDDASRWAAQAKLVEIDLDNARAEVERWKAEAEMLTAKVDRLMPLQEHENECAYRQRTEKAEAEVERLRANSALPSYSEIEEVISDAFEQGIGLTFEGGIPQAVIGRVMAAIIAARGRESD